MKIGIVGVSGYGGGELLRLLGAHPTFEVAAVAGNRAAGAEVRDVFPQLAGTATGGLRIGTADPSTVRGCDLVFLATPAAVSMALAPPLLAAGARVVDLSGAFRLPPTVYETWYGETHTAPGHSPAVYGLPELFRAEVSSADLVAGPGCYATAALLALWPLTGLVDPATVTVVGLSGVSGAGRGLRDDLHAAHAMANVAPYGAPRHRHTPEIATSWRRAATQHGWDVRPAVTFVPHLVPMTRGLVATVTASLSPAADGDDVLGAVADRYDAEPFVTVTPGWPSTAHVLGGNGAHVHAAIDDDTGRVVVSCAIDNLGKGAAGQAVQAANLLAGVSEDAGLTATGVYP